jgi:hypothetical protein
MTQRLTRTLLCTCLIVLSASASPRPALADPWMPLDLGMRWEYRGVGGSHQVETITGFPVLRGRTVAAKYYSEGTDAGLENYWLLAPDGGVLLAGFNNPSAAFALLYEPPIAYLPGPPALGVSRSTDVTAYNLSDGTVYATFTIHFTILEEVDLALPAGMYHALGTGQVVPAPRGIVAGGRTFSLDGRLLSGASTGLGPSASDWFTDGVGVVQYQGSDLYQLVSAGLPTPTARSSWTAIKRLFH